MDFCFAKLLRVSNSLTVFRLRMSIDGIVKMPLQASKERGIYSEKNPNIHSFDFLFIYKYRVRRAGRKV